MSISLLRNLLKKRDLDIIQFFICLPLFYKLEVLKHLKYFPEYIRLFIEEFPILSQNEPMLNTFWRYMIVKNRFISTKYKEHAIQTFKNGKTTFCDIFYHKTLSRNIDYYHLTYEVHCRTYILAKEFIKLKLLNTDNGFNSFFLGEIFHEISYGSWTTGINKDILYKNTIENYVSKYIEDIWLHCYTPYTERFFNINDIKLADNIFDKYFDLSQYVKAIKFQCNFDDAELRQKILLEYPMPKRDDLPWLTISKKSVILNGGGETPP